MRKKQRPSKPCTHSRGFKNSLRAHGRSASLSVAVSRLWWFGLGGERWPNGWEAEFDVTPGKSSEQQIMHALDGHFAKAWRKVHETSSGGKMTSAWKFKGDDKKPWNAEVCLKKVGSAFVLSTTLHKAEAGRSS